MSFRSSAPDPTEAPIPTRDADPITAVVHAAVADRPLEEVAHLITLLEQSPQYAQATVDALRAIGTSRSVEDVTRLVALLTRPPRDPESADEAIRAAAECRPVEEVTRLMSLLSRTPLEPHAGREAARVAATARPIEDLVELIGRMSVERDTPAPPEAPPDADPFAAQPQERPDDRPAVQPLAAGPPPAARPAPARPAAADPFGAEPGDVESVPPIEVIEGRTPRRLPRTAESPPARRHLAWPSLAAAGVLLLCALLWFPPHGDGVPMRAYGFALGVFVLCALLSVLLTVRPALPVLAGAVVVPALLAAAQVFEGRVHSAQLSQALSLALAPSWVAGLAAVFASLTALVALLVRLTWQPPVLETAAPRQLAEAGPAEG
ncbi:MULTISPECIES: YIP1 family protein [Streptomyces]|uniref:YIP1 family protein n=1 Tax=Streptomyces doudnae TaxID=3075536 RepID=A0ABD5EKD7_9ACTN|nr:MULTISPECIES: YIP1 family protein [unclassified Streptomyces]MDT0433867.1 YIP1 family protein [Streptomyces sp. DSM 41981]MYQ64699.1 hypothetical protein [Streptomyces sp. SID4950]SCD84380.1 hypothetical protein GA0115242_115759 [Streptomyces sp. SolWspMP-5a-2]